MAARKSALNISDSLRASVDGFVEDLTSLVRASLMSVIASGSTLAGAARRRSRPAAARRRGAKRDPRVVAALTSKLSAFIAKNPGKRIEQIAQELGVSSRELVLSVRKLLAERVITTRGQRRATRYFPARARAARRARKAPVRRKVKKRRVENKARSRRKAR